MASLRGSCFLAALAVTDGQVFLKPTKVAGGGLQVPIGVNFGGWLNLEDWFHSGTGGSDVMTAASMPQGQGACLPPLATSFSQNWPSEGVLVKRLNFTEGPNRTAEIFMAHRRAYIGNSDLRDVAAAGIKKVRVPLNWGAFADALIPIDSEIYGSHDPDEDAAVVPDPYYHEHSAIVTVPRSWLRTFLRRCAKHGLTVLLDMHAMPGGSSDGTYNGIWPASPKFWMHNSLIGNTNVKLTDAGQMIAAAMVKFVETLPAEERSAVAGITFMNEPAHQAHGKDWVVNSAQVLDWLAEAGDKFRKSKLPEMGMKMYCNVIETAFTDFYTDVPAWWNKAFTELEQYQWAVMDIHWYSAWSGSSCSGRNVQGGAYFCDQPLDEIQPIYQECLSNQTDKVNSHFKGLKAVSEFSLGTFYQSHAACTDKAVRELYLNEQVQSFTAAGIEPFFWTWRMPYGQAFEAGWSLKHMLGMESQHRDFSCGSPSSATAVEL